MKKRVESRLEKLESEGQNGELPLVTLVQDMNDPDLFKVGQTVIGRFTNARTISSGGEMITAAQAETYGQDHNVEVLKIIFTDLWRDHDMAADE